MVCKATMQTSHFLKVNHAFLIRSGFFPDAPVKTYYDGPEPIITTRTLTGLAVVLSAKSSSLYLLSAFNHKAIHDYNAGIASFYSSGTLNIAGNYRNKGYGTLTFNTWIRLAKLVFPLDTRVTGFITESHEDNARFYGQFGLLITDASSKNNYRFSATLGEIEPVNHRITGEAFGYCPDDFVREGITFAQYAKNLI
jgi:hypothetical protein